MHAFTPVESLLGGALIGVSASAVLLCNGRIAGVSGILAGVLGPWRGDAAWRLLFLAGLVGGGALLARVWPGAFAMELDRSTGALLASGLLVGFGARLGSGCTSGHGLCGVSRRSRRSLAATAIFMAAGMGSAFLVRRFLDGVL